MGGGGVCKIYVSFFKFIESQTERDKERDIDKDRKTRGVEQDTAKGGKTDREREKLVK